MNKITRSNKPTPKTGQLFALSGCTYLLCEYNHQFFLANLETGTTWNGFKGSIDEVFRGNNIEEINYPITLTPQNK